MKKVPTIGVEIEYPFADQEGNPFFASNTYFEKLAEKKMSHGESTNEKKIDETVVGLSTPWGESGFDNGKNNGESALGVVTLEGGPGLDKMSDVVQSEVNDVVSALKTQNAHMLNMSNNPLAEINADTYEKARINKPVYNYINNYRRWSHVVGIDAKAQNSPSTGTSVTDSIKALNVIMGSGALFVGIFANSPFEERRVSGLCETRLSMWKRMFKTSVFESDRFLMHNPTKPFGNLRDYFTWMFGANTTMYFTLDSSTDYKKSKSIVVIPENPNLLTFLRSKSWKGKTLDCGDDVIVTPSFSHLELHQFTQFASARIRYGIKESAHSLSEFNSAMHGSGSEVEDFFQNIVSYMYIEGRDPGAIFPDAWATSLSDSSTLVNTMSTSPLAIQIGLQRNADEAFNFIQKTGWDVCQNLRQAAIENGLEGYVHGLSVHTFCEQLLAIARDGLQEYERKFLKYPELVLNSKENAAMRALNEFNSLEGTEEEKIRTIVKNRFVSLT